MIHIACVDVSTGVEEQVDHGSRARKMQWRLSVPAAF